MVQVISKNKTHTTLRVSNRVLGSFSLGKKADAGRILVDTREYIENEEERLEIEKIKKELAQGKFLTLKEFLLEN